MNQDSDRGHAAGRRAFLVGLAGAAAGGALGAGAKKQAPAKTVAPKQISGTPKLQTGPPASNPWQHTTDKVLRIGIVGGRFGATFQWHLHPNCKVTAVCDIRPDRLKALQKVYKCDAGFLDYATFLKEGKMDAVGIFTPAPLHVSMALDAYKTGRHVISAVPAGMSLEELQALIEATKKSGLAYMMAETSRFRPEIMACVEASRRGDFGTIFYSEAEYHHEGLMAAYYFDEQGRPTWRYGFPPMHYPTHSVGMIVPVTGERLTEVTAIGWGDGHKVLKDNEYKNPFWNTTGLFKTSGGHACRVSVCWHISAGGIERGQFFGDRMSFIMQRPDNTENVVYKTLKAGELSLDPYGYAQGDPTKVDCVLPDFYVRMPPPMRVPSGHGGSHTFIAHEFIDAVLAGRKPLVDVCEAAAYTAPGIVAHQSALQGGVTMKIPDLG